MYEYIKYDVADKVATISFNRPKALNAITPDMEDELHAALDEADADASVHCIILTGEGTSFSAGYDLNGTDEKPGGILDPTGDTIGEYLDFWYSFDSGTIDKLTHLWKLKKPVIGAVRGYAMGGGFWYQIATDITLAGESAVFAQPEVRHISNTTFLFVALCGWKVANRFALTGDHMDAAEALRVGLVNEVVPDDELMERARTLAKRIAAVPFSAVRMNKALAMRGLLASGLAGALQYNGAMSTLGHASHGPERDKIFEGYSRDGMRGYLKARDGEFLPEPFGPKAKAASEGGQK